MELAAPSVFGADRVAGDNRATESLIDIESVPPQCVRISGGDFDNAFKHYTWANVVFMHVNARDLRVLDRIAHLELLVNNCNKVVDVLAVSETWLRSSEEAVCYTLENFIHISSRRSKRLGGGVSVFVRRGWSIIERTEKSSVCDAVQLVRVTLARQGSLFTVIAFYSRAFSCMEVLLNILEPELRSKTVGTVVLLGDSNVDLFDVSAALPYTGFMASCGMVSCIDQPTRAASGTCIDHIWIGCYPESFVLKAGVIETSMIADHFPIVLFISDLNGRETPACQLTGQSFSLRRIFSSSNFQRFSEELQKVNWNYILSMDDANAAYNAFEVLLFEKYDICFPVRSFPHKQSRSSPWYNKALHNMRRNLDKLYSKSRKPENAILRKTVNWYRRAYRRTLKFQCNSFHNQAYLRLRGKPKAFWQHINACVGRRSNKHTAPDRLAIGDQQVVGPANVAEAFCKYFSEIADDTVPHVAPSAEILNGVERLFASVPEFSLSNLTFEDILNGVKGMKVDFKGSITNVPSKVIKQSISLLLVPLSCIYNKSIGLGQFPLALKKTLCIPVYKGKGDPLLPSSYRPIALTSFCAKLFERCVKRQLELHFEKAALLSQAQFGFRSKRSTEIALCNMAEFIAANCEGGHGVLAVFLDVAKAFDCVSHDMLIALMEHANFHRASISWFHSFLTGRKIAVSVNKVTSTAKSIYRGVPQGSVLGPYLFIFYINPLLFLIEENCPGLQVVAYADDTTLLFQVKKGAVSDSTEILNKYLIYVHNLFREFMLAINISKTKLIFFKSVHCRIELPQKAIIMNEIALETSSSSEVLGLTFSADLKWMGHYAAASRKCYGMVTTLARLKQLGHSTSLLIKIYKALFEPILFYGIPIWGTTHSNVLQKFQVLQNDALRAIYKLKRHQSARGVFAQENLLTVASMAKYKICLLMFKKYAGRMELDVDCLPMPSGQSYSLRSESERRVLQPFCRSVIRQQGPKISFVKTWNSLPLSIKTSSTITKFKDSLYKYLLQNNFNDFQ